MFIYNKTNFGSCRYHNTLTLPKICTLYANSVKFLSLKYHHFFVYTILIVTYAIIIIFSTDVVWM